MDPLLVTLANAGAGVFIGGVCTGSLCHADDLRSVTPSLSSLEKQVDIIKSFVSANSLSLNLDKLDLLAMSRGQIPPECSLTVEQPPLPLLGALELSGLIIFHPKPPLKITSIRQEERFLA